MPLLIIRKKVLIALRDIRIQIAGSTLVALMLVAVLVGRQGQKLVQKERATAQAVMYDKWVNQGEKHPHSAAHYGQFAFKPKPVLSFLDMGLDQFSGIPVFLEAYKQNELLYSAAQDSNGMTRFGELTAGFILLIKRLLRLIIVWSTCALLILLGFIIQGISISQHADLFLQWHFVIFGYALFWTALMAGIVALKQSTALSAMSGLSLWLMLTLITPAILNLATLLIPLI